MAITNNEILLMAEVVSREKNLDKEIIFRAIEAALATATRKWHTGEIDARVSIHRDTGDYDTFRVWEVVPDDDEISFPGAQIALSEARESGDEVEVGDLIEEPMDKVEFRPHRRPGRQAGHHAEGP